MRSADAGDERTAEEPRFPRKAQEQLEQLVSLRTLPAEWRKRGMRDPATIRALVQQRLEQSDALEAEVRYADFLCDPEYGWS
ncbi:hypothetical protein ASF23_16955 [Curtobacterium sp. Leaf261]|nr:hypothetical protein ASF23_16955 [Curtobacterium sp. Leaf261]